MQHRATIEEKSESANSSISSMVPPSVRIEGCTPPSDSSLEGELNACKDLSYFFDKGKVDRGVIKGGVRGARAPVDKF